MVAGMVQASENGQLFSNAIFSGPMLSVTETASPPRLFDVSPPNAPVEGGIEVTIAGTGLDVATEVSLAGVPAEILKKSPCAVTVKAGAAKEPLSGDVEVGTPDGSASLTNAFNYLGTSFKRGDFDGNFEIELADAINMLYYLFIGGVFPNCLEALDANGDGEPNISDPHLELFVSQRPAPAAAV